VVRLVSPKAKHNGGGDSHLTSPSDCPVGSSSQPDPTHDVQADDPIPVIQDVGSYLALLYAEIAAFHPLHCLEIA